MADGSLNGCYRIVALSGIHFLKSVDLIDKWVYRLLPEKPSTEGVRILQAYKRIKSVALQ
jgi:hypothetical protein